MHLGQFTKSGACLSGGLCQSCRDEGAAGDRFRASLVRCGWQLPADAPRFDCSRKPWGYRPDPATLAAEEAERELIAAAMSPQGLGDHVTRLIHRVGADRAWAAVRKATGMAEGCGGCNARREALNRLGEWMKRTLG